VPVIFGFRNVVCNRMRIGLFIVLLSLHSETFLFQVVRIEPVVHHAIARDVILDVVLHVFCSSGVRSLKRRSRSRLFQMTMSARERFLAWSPIHAATSSSVAPVATNDLYAS